MKCLSSSVESSSPNFAMTAFSCSKKFGNEIVDSKRSFSTSSLLTPVFRSLFSFRISIKGTELLSSSSFGTYSLIESKSPI